MRDVTKWDYDKAYHFLRGDEPKEWTLHEIAVHLSRMDVENGRLADALDACAEEQVQRETEVKRLRTALYYIMHGQRLDYCHDGAASALKEGDAR